MAKAQPLKVLLITWLALAVFITTPSIVYAADYFHIVVLSDVHYPTKNTSQDSAKSERIVTAKQAALDRINSWPDVDLVVFLGDIVAQAGTEQEYRAAKEFVDKVSKPVAVIAGNHEYMYADARDAAGRLMRAHPDYRLKKLQRFQDTFGLPDLSYARVEQGHLLLFLSVDATDSRYLTALSGYQLFWLQEQLKSHPGMPAIVFFHAPLAGTLAKYNQTVETENFIAQPERQIRELILRNNSIRLWVSGHTHTPPTNASFNAAINTYAGSVINIHNPDLDRERIWTNSLFIYQDRVVIRTFDHKQGEWLPAFDRVVYTQ